MIRINKQNKKKKRRRSGKKRIEKPIKKIMVMRTTYCNSWIFKVEVTSGDKQQEKNPEKTTIKTIYVPKKATATCTNSR